MVERRPIAVHGCAGHPRWAEAQSVALGPLPGSPVVTVTFPYATGAYTVHVAITVADRDTGEPQQYGFTLEVPDRCPVAGGLSAVLRRAYDHELDENIYASGVRVYEPHPEPLATPATAADDSARRGSGGL